ncbi:MAG: hypothetical protein WCV90_02765 [Candidatus Woesearchaeota archaeon]|jgi:hypothetical protein
MQLLDENIERRIRKSLLPEQIITLNDYPVHSATVLGKYFDLFCSGKYKELQPVPVIHKSIGMLQTPSEDSLSFNLSLQKYLEENPVAEYFLLNGNHRTTAATLSRTLIEVYAFEHDGDIDYARRVSENDILVEPTLSANCDDLGRHFCRTVRFETVREKTERMVVDRVIPLRMIEYYLAGNQ